MPLLGCRGSSFTPGPSVIIDDSRQWFGCELSGGDPYEMEVSDGRPVCYRYCRLRKSWSILLVAIAFVVENYLSRFIP